MHKNAILGVDPGNTATGWALVDAETLRPLAIGKQNNELAYVAMIESCSKLMEEHPEGLEIYIAIEMIASYGMAVGREVFDTCVWIGQLKERFRGWLANVDLRYVYRKEEKLTICNSPRANDSTIRQSLIDRFAYGEKNYGKGTKKNPGWFYGFRADIWAAYAVAVTYHDLYYSQIAMEERLDE
jgi:hypothetical protein